MTSIARHGGPHKVPRFASLSNRLRTFETAKDLFWNGQVFTDTLAAHGFFYTGGSDVVRCYHCGVELHTWREADDVMVEHFRHSPGCHLAAEGMNFNPRTEKLMKAVLKTIKDLKREMVERNRNICFV